MAAEAPPVLEVHGLGKKLARELEASRRHGTRDILRDLRFGNAKPGLRAGEFWALREIDFQVAPGEAIGVIGHNGAGKSTLLRVLSGLTRPDVGSVTIRGRHTALLDIIAPFNRVLSGRENIETAAAVHGVPRRKTADLIEAVGDFSELAAVLDAPMWTYSTGMQMRLGYGIAAQLDVQLLLIDEVIAVGDIAFQRKCVNHIRGHLRRGGSLVLVSHDIWMIQTICRRCVLLDNGTQVIDASTDEAIATYFEEQRQRHAFVPRARNGASDAPAARASAEVLSAGTPEGHPPRNGEDVTIEAKAWTTEPSDSATWRIDLLTSNRQVCVAQLRPPNGTTPIELTPEPTSFSCTIPKLPLLPGRFYLSVHLQDAATGEEIGSTEDPFALKVESRHTRLDTLALFAGAISSLDALWEIAEADDSSKRAGAPQRVDADDFPAGPAIAAQPPQRS